MSGRSGKAGYLTENDLDVLKTEAVLRRVAWERRHQRAKWGGAEHDARHTPDEWRGLILQRAVKQGGEFDKGFDRDFVEIAALAVAALESKGRIPNVQ